MHRKPYHGFAFIGILIALLIIGLLMWAAMKIYFKPAPAANPLMRDAGVPTSPYESSSPSSYKSVIDAARKITQDAANAKPREYPGLK